MSQKMIHPHQRQMVDLTDPFGVVEPHQLSGDQPRSLSDSDSGDIFKGDTGLLQSSGNHRSQSFQMFPCGKLRNHTAVDGVFGDL